MNARTLLVLSILGCYHINVSAQGESALPFLLISPSAEGNGWGGISTAVPSEDAISVAANPGQLGFLSRRTLATVSTYSNKSQWLPAFQQDDLTYNVLAATAGYDLSKALPLPFPISVGLGYSRIDLNLGTFVRTNSSGQVIGRYTAREKSEQFSVGIGVDYFVRLGIGWNSKRVRSTLGPPLSDLPVSLYDFGLLLEIPVVEIVNSLVNNPDDYRKITPLANISFGYARSNLGVHGVQYVDVEASDPLPRNLITGLGLKVGASTRLQNGQWEILTISLAREAEDLLISRKSDGTFTYDQTVFGKISLWKNVVRGINEADVNARHGWQVNIADFISVRGGSYAESPYFGNRNYTTSGYTLRLGGIFKLMEFADPEVLNIPALSFIANHLDLSFTYASYSDHEILGGTEFNSFTVVLK